MVIPNDTVKRKMQEAIAARAEPEPNTGCFLWTGNPTKAGYGVINLKHADGRILPRLVHRVAWEVVNGPIPSGMVVCHSCDVRLCCNTDHMFVGTRGENQADMARKWRGSRSVNGMPFGVLRHHNKFSARVTFNNITYRAGDFSTIEEAAAVAADLKNALRWYKRAA